MLSLFSIVHFWWFHSESQKYFQTRVKIPQLKCFSHAKKILLKAGSWLLLELEFEWPLNDILAYFGVTTIDLLFPHLKGAETNGMPNQVANHWLWLVDCVGCHTYSYYRNLETWQQLLYMGGLQQAVIVYNCFIFTYQECFRLSSSPDETGHPVSLTNSLF